MDDVCSFDWLIWAFVPSTGRLVLLNYCLEVKSSCYTIMPNTDSMGYRRIINCPTEIERYTFFIKLNRLSLYMMINMYISLFLYLVFSCRYLIYCNNWEYRMLLWGAFDLSRYLNDQGSWSVSDLEHFLVAAINGESPLWHLSAPSQYKDRLIYVWRFPC